VTLPHRGVGAHHGEPYRLQVRYACEDIDLLRRAYARSRATSSNAWPNTKWARR
jgi:hypothetical protein